MSEPPINWRGRYEACAKLRSHAVEYAAAAQTEIARLRGGTCHLAGPGRGDCEHAVGLPGHSVPDQHDGPNDTVDVYGKPNGWCWHCWQQAEIARLRGELERRAELWECPDCAFGFDKCHTNTDGTYSCPLCDLTALRSRLPQTADGVAVVPGMDEVFHDEWDCPTQLQIIGPDHMSFDDAVQVAAKDQDNCPDWVVAGFYYESDTGYSETMFHLVNDCYSTRAAAEAARGQT